MNRPASNDSAPAATVGISAYSRPDLLRDAMQSIINQTYQNWQLIVVDDCSPSSLEPLVSEFADERISYYRNEKNLGQAGTRNRILALAETDFLAYLDDDDEWTPDKLEKQMELMVSTVPSPQVVCCGWDEVNESANHRVLLPEIGGDIRASIVRNSGPHHVIAGHLFITAALRDIGGYDTALRSHTEYDNWLQMARAGYRFVSVREPLLIVKSHAGIRKTTDIRERVLSAEKFFEKWGGDLDDWAGPRGNLRSRFYTRMMSMVAHNALADRNIRGFLSVAIVLARRHPLNVGTYTSLGKSMVYGVFDATPFLPQSSHLSRKLRRVVGRTETASTIQDD